MPGAVPRDRSHSVSTTTMRIRVTNLDSIQQAQLWRHHGPQEAIARVVAMVRSALLLSEELVLDRNQLLDGIALLVLGPDGLRWHLGLPPHSPLPLTISGQPDADTGEVDVGTQLDAMLEESFDSSAMAALDVNQTASSPLHWLLQTPAARSVVAEDVHGLRPAPTSPERAQEHSTVVDEARRAWAEAMRRGEVTLTPWSAIQVQPAPHEIIALASEHPVVDELLEAMRDRTSRSAALRFLDGRRDHYGVAECRAAFHWWTEKYYDAICDANDEIRISFHSVGTTDTDALWTEPAPRNRWQMVRSRLSRHEVSPRGEIPFEGEIVENMRVIPPSTFQLLRQSPHRSHDFWEHPSNRKIWNLALTVRRSIADAQVQRGRRIAMLLGRALLAISVALLLGLRELQLVPSHGGWWLLFWAVLAVLLAAPWALLFELFSLTSYSMTATLRIASDRIPRASEQHRSVPDRTDRSTAPAPATPSSPHWHDIWRAANFDLAVQRTFGVSGREIHRVQAMGGQAGAVALCRCADDDGTPRTLLVHSRRPAIGTELWELPRGFGDGTDASPAQTALREYQEETGRTAVIREDLGAIYPDSGLQANAVHVVILEDEANEEAANIDGEVEGYRWYTDAGIDQLITERKIADGITLASLHLVGHGRRAANSSAVIPA